MDIDKKEQVKPLAPRAALHIDIDDHKPHAASTAKKSITRLDHKCIRCCGCSTAILLILLMIVLILAFTVCHIKDPVIKMNSVDINGLQDLLNSNTKNKFLQGINLTISADISVKNSNAASFRFDQMETYVYYNGSVVGDVTTPAGRVMARRTLPMNISIDVMVDKLLQVRRFKSDLIAGIFPLRTYTRISGKVKITDAIKRSFVVKMNCTMNVNIRSKIIQDKDCRRRVS